MYEVKKKIEVSGAHALELNYDSKCENLHGHNWVITVTCRSNELDSNGMVVDFSRIKEIVHQLDHQNMNLLLDFNPTAENIARWIHSKVPHCYRVDVQESSGNTASYISKKGL